MKTRLFKAGTYRQQYQYKCFTPAPINRPFAWNDPGMDVLLKDATRFLGELNAYSRLVPDVDFFISHAHYQRGYHVEPHRRHEKNIDEDVLPLDEIEPERRFS